MAPSNVSSRFSSNNNGSVHNDLMINSNKFLDSNCGMRSFFMQIDSIFYEREKNCNYNIYNCSNTTVFNKESYPNFSAKIIKEKVENLKKMNIKRKSRLVLIQLNLFAFIFINKNKFY